MPRRKPAARWEGRLGVWPIVVWYGEREDKGGVCYLRWYLPERRNWKWQSCRTKVRDQRGHFDADAQARVLELAKRRHDLLTGKVTETSDTGRSPITLAESWSVLTDPDTGRFPIRTRYRDTLKTAIDDAAKVLGASFAWMHFGDAEFTNVTRRKVRDARERGFAGLKSGIALGTSLITVMGLLKDAKRIPANVAVPGGRRWRSDLRRYVTDLAGGIEPEVKRPRHTIEEARAILAKADQVDPRFALLIALGAELRLGQVCRARRVHLDLEKGLFRTPGRGDKKGAILELTAGQRAAVTRALGGYLAPLEAALPDYPLFPQGMLVRNKDTGHLVAHPVRHGAAEPVHRRTLNDWFRAAETIAQVPHVEGRAAYGIRRVAVDQALAAGISPDGLQEHGGWSSDRMPQTIYREQQREKARTEARDVRALIRGETGPANVPESYPATPNKPTGRSDADDAEAV